MIGRERVPAIDNPTPAVMSLHTITNKVITPLMGWIP
jgi:hypothetical protein